MKMKKQVLCIVCVLMVFPFLILITSCGNSTPRLLSENGSVNDVKQALAIWDEIQPNYQEALHIIYATPKTARDKNGNDLHFIEEGGHRYVLIEDEKYLSVDDLKNAISDVFTEKFVENNINSDLHLFKGGNTIYIERKGKLYVNNVEVYRFLPPCDTPPQKIEVKDSTIKITFFCINDEYGEHDVCYALRCDNKKWKMDGMNIVPL